MIVFWIKDNQVSSGSIDDNIYDEFFNFAVKHIIPLTDEELSKYSKVIKESKNTYTPIDVLKEIPQKHKWSFFK